MDYYNVLGVKAGETSEIIKASYRKLAKKYHPDANPGDEDAARCFKEAAEAYSVLGDPDKRTKYDEEQKKQQVNRLQPERVRAQQEVHFPDSREPVSIMRMCLPVLNDFSASIPKPVRLIMRS